MWIPACLNLALMQDRYRLFVFINSDKRKCPCDGLFPMFRIHFFDKDVNLHLQAGSPYMYHPAYELNDSAGWNRMIKIDPVTAHSHHLLPTESGGGDKRHFIHQVHRGASKKCVVVIGGIWKYGFENPCFRILHFFLKGHESWFNFILTLRPVKGFNYL